jgi:hypothetical protein
MQYPKTHSGEAKRVSMHLRTLSILSLMLVSACDTKDWEAAGYQDGYAAIINTACKIRTTPVWGKYDTAAYAKGYSRGANAAAVEIHRLGCQGIRQYYGVRD